MTVFLYNNVLDVVDSTPRTIGEIMSILFKDMKYECDRKARKNAVNKALRQLIDDGKVIMEKRLKDDSFVPVYYLSTKNGPKTPQTKYEYTLSLMEDGVWYTICDLVEMVYHKPDIGGIYYSRISKAMHTLYDKGLVIKRPMGVKNSYGTDLMEWKSIV